MFKKLRDNRGVALETAIIMILVMYSFATILYIVSYREKMRDNVGNFKMNLPYQIEEVGEKFYSSCLDNTFESFNYDQGNYVASTSIESGNYVLIVTDKTSDAEVLKVKVSIESKEITQWRFNNPLYDEINRNQENIELYD